ncbi:MAG TPA: hypothetical protein VK009_23535 [Chloroflexota bacterium]|nr:hypothetical protein [Chloroflexota bacterium]
MQLIFERGDQSRPKGHALVYFRDPGSSAVLATYIVVPPITIDFSKYLPPMFAGQGMAANLAQASSIVPLPPVPETVESLGMLRILAEQRDDDLILAGDASPSEIDRLLGSTTEAAQLYFHMYQDFARTFPSTPSEPAEAAIEGPSAEELTFALMGERDRLGELAKLAGTLRYALEGNDQHLADETTTRMRLLAKHMAPKYWADRAVEAAATPGATAGRLSQLYLERGYKLLDEDYAAVAQLDAQIEQVSQTS